MTRMQRTLAQCWPLSLLGLFFIGIGLSAAMPNEQGEVPATLPMGPGPRMQGSAVYPAQEIPLRFSHAEHLAMNLSCTSCHEKVTTSTRSSELNLPTGKSCDGCHGPQHPPPLNAPKDCGMCHTQTRNGQVTKAVRVPRPKLHFNHKAHLERGASCDQCHPNMRKVRLATVEQLPKEGMCLQCHNGLRADNRCSLCHVSDASGRLVTTDLTIRTSPKLMPHKNSNWGAVHDLAFVEDHRGIAKANPQLCNNCHSPNFCLDCHNGPIRPLRIHAGDYLTTHALDARAGTQDCQSCHRLQSDCLACHQRLGLQAGAEGAFGVGSSLRFHPADWSGPLGSPQTHAFAAQRNLATCVSCHSEDTCLACHATSQHNTKPGWGVSPHGPGFASSMRCQALASQNRRVCLKCHTPGDSSLECI